MSKHSHIHLTADERTELTELIKRGGHAARVLNRAYVLLLLDRSQGEQRTIAEGAASTLVSDRTVSNIKKRYLTEGVARAIYDAARPGAAPIIDGEVEAHLIAVACSDLPRGRARWTLRLLAERLVSLELVEAVSHVTVGEVLKKTNLSLGQ